MKAITIWQPWASLWACGAKKFETRGWATSYRGPIAIHAAEISIYRVLRQVFPLGEWDYAPDFKAKQELMNAVRKAFGTASTGKDIIQYLSELPRGAVIATADLIDCHEIVLHGGRGLSSESPGWLETDRGIYEPTEQELLFGNWTPGRYAWEIANAKMLPEPIPAKGKQRIWNWEAKS